MPDQETHSLDSEPATKPDMLLQQVAITDVAMNRLIAARVTADDDLAFEIVTDSMVERLNSNERITIVQRILEVDLAGQKEAGLDSDEVRQVVADLRDIYELRNKIAHAAVIEWSGDKDGCKLVRVRRGAPVVEILAFDELWKRVSRAVELMQLLQRVGNRHEQTRARQMALRRRLGLHSGTAAELNPGT
jgi:hypothetical protein